MTRTAGRAGRGGELAPEHLEFAVRQLVLRTVLRDAGDVLCAAVAHWRDVCRYTRALWRGRIAAVSRRVHRLARRTMSALQAFLEHRRYKKRVAIDSLLRAADRVQRGGLRGWVAWCNHRAAKAAAMQLALRHRASSLVKSSQREWLAAAMAAAAHRQHARERMLNLSATRDRHTFAQVCRLCVLWDRLQGFLLGSPPCLCDRWCACGATKSWAGRTSSRRSVLSR
jgi:hypothetical protein